MTITLDQALAEAEASERAGSLTAAVVLLRRVRELETILQRCVEGRQAEERLNVEGGLAFADVQSCHSGYEVTLPPGYRGRVLLPEGVRQVEATACSTAEFLP